MIAPLAARGKTRGRANAAATTHRRVLAVGGLASGFGRSRGFIAVRTAMNRSSRSNQNGAPNVTANAVRSQPNAIVSTSSTSNDQPSGRQGPSQPCSHPNRSPRLVNSS